MYAAYKVIFRRFITPPTETSRSEHRRQNTFSLSQGRVEVVQLKCYEKTINWNAHYITDWSCERDTNGVVDGALLVLI